MNCLLIIENGKKNRQKKPRRAQINKKGYCSIRKKCGN